MTTTGWGLPAGPARRVTSLGRLGDLLVGALIICYIVFGLSVLLRPSGQVLAWADLGAYNAVFALAAALMILRGVRGERPWILIGSGLLLTAVGGVLWSLSETWALPQTFVPIPDLLWMTFYPLAFITIVQLGRAQLRSSRNFRTLDSLLAGSGAFTLGLVAIGTALAVNGQTGVTTEYVINASYLLGDLVLIALVVVVAQAFGWRLPLAWTLLLTGLLAYAIGDAAYLVAVNQGTYVEGTLIDLLWPTACLLFGLAAVVARPLPITGEGAAPVGGRSWAIVPSLAVLVSGAVLVGAALNIPDTLSWPPILFASITLVLGVIRLDLALRASQSLSEQLRAAQLDSLTGLPNRRGIASIEQAGSVIAIDIDDMASFNRSLGMDRADQVLLAVAARLRAAVRDDDVVARVGGDEFSVLLRQTDAAQATAIAEELVHVIEEPLVIDGLHLHVSACAGVATAEGAGYQPAVELLAEAVEALRRAKAEGPGLVRSQEGAIGRRSIERLQRRAEIRRALSGDGAEVIPYFQPIVSLRDGQVLVCEALARWRHDGRILSPDDFMEDLVQSASIPALTRHMLTTSLRAISDAGLSFAVAVNVPPELVTPELVAQVKHSLKVTGVPAQRLAIEVTETAILRNPQAAADVLRELRDMGVLVLLDDFGTGWSGLSSLRDLGIDGLKLDYSFVSRMATDDTTAAIVRGVAGVADELGILVIYEGVEDPEVNAMVSALPSGYVQGFAVARPMPIDDLTAWARAHPAG